MSVQTEVDSSHPLAHSDLTELEFLPGEERRAGLGSLPMCPGANSNSLLFLRNVVVVPAKFYFFQCESVQYGFCCFPTSVFSWFTVDFSLVLLCTLRSHSAHQALQFSVSPFSPACCFVFVC